MSRTKTKKYFIGKKKKHFYGKEYEYESFVPSLINKSFEWRDKKINILLEEGIRLLGEVNAYSVLIPNVDFFIKMHVVKEATKSSRIEGTRTNVGEVVMDEKELSPEKRDDWQEVQNYIKAVNYSIKEVKKIPLSLRLLKQGHKILLSGARGKEKQPGEVRTSQNWIGAENIESAAFIPPHPLELPKLLSDLEEFWHNDELQIPKLIKIALSHYQFETIHPFLDGNGRIGRLLIVLQLINYDILTKPSLYLSDYFEKNRAAYYDSLTRVRQSGSANEWLKFFLTGIISTSKSGIETFDKIIKLRQEYEAKIFEFGRQASLGKDLLFYLFGNPIVSIGEVSKELDIAFNTANSVISKFVKSGLLEEKTGRSRDKLFVMKKYLSMFAK